jgi:hypothetical protein
VSWITEDISIRSLDAVEYRNCHSCNCLKFSVISFWRFIALECGFGMNCETLCPMESVPKEDNRISVMKLRQYFIQFL